MAIDPNLKKHALKILTSDGDPATLAVLEKPHIPPLTLMYAVSELDPDMKAIFEPLIQAHLKLSASIQGAGRRDVKELINPYKIYSFYPTPQERHHIEAGAGENKQENIKKEGSRFRLF